MASVSAGNDLLGVREITVGVVFTALAIAAVSGRLWARNLKKTPAEASDYLIVVALFFTVSLNATIVVAGATGASGRHQDNTTASQTVILGKAFVIAGVLWAVAIAFVKGSILAFYIRLFRNEFFRKATYVLMGLTATLAVVVILATLLICRPLAYNWNPTINGTCGDTHKLYLSGGIVNLLLDVSIVILPMPMLWGLQMKLSKKLALIVILGLGAFVCIISVLRIVSIQHLNLLDLPYTSASDGIWSVLEPSLGTVTACLPIMQPVLSKVNALTSSIFSRTGGTSQRSLRASSRRMQDQNNHKKDPEDMLYPLSNIGGTINNFDTNLSRSETDTLGMDRDGDVVPHNTINVKKVFDVTSERTTSA